MFPQELSFTRWIRSTPGQLTLIGFLVIAGYLLTAHTEHVFRATLLVLLLLCPVVHFFTPPGRGGHHEQAPQSQLNTKSEKPLEQREHNSDVASRPHNH